MKQFKLITITLLACSLTACAGNHRGPDREPPPMKEELLTTITPSGLKIFTYTVSLGGTEQGGRGMPPVGHGPDGGTPRHGSRDGKFMERIEQGLLTKLTETGFCREGYIKLGNSMNRKEAYVRGECVEGANKVDRKIFASRYN
ncbi:MAG: hypothetical protein HND53_00780 [Proteobacteria bacterium]|nr:hypothetical protein [Pseudomonadota bacterium]NOG59007.1 hypothetical protein [Pseudomonadota bacterium]